MTPVERLCREYAATGRTVPWSLDASLRTDPGLLARNRSAALIATLPTTESAQLNGSLPADDMEALVRAAERHLLTAPLRGFGIDLGAGLGVLAATIAKRAGVECVVAVDVCSNFVEDVIPRVANEVLGERRARVVPVLGSFDSIELDDECLDFAVEIDSLHHAPDLVKALRECSRVLRHGGRLICFDRAHHDDLPESLRARMLDHIYDEAWIRRNGYPPGVSMSRRDNGEHEITLREWRDSFDAAGLTLETTIQFVPRIGAKVALKGLVSRLPSGVRRHLITLPLLPGYPSAWMLRKLGLGGYARRVVAGPKLTTGFAVRKP